MLLCVACCVLFAVCCLLLVVRCVLLVVRCCMLVACVGVACGLFVGWFAIVCVLFAD